MKSGSVGNDTVCERGYSQ